VPPLSPYGYASVPMPLSMLNVGRVKAKGEIKLTFSSTLGAGGASSGVDSPVKLEEQPASVNTDASITTTTASHTQDDLLADPDDIVSEFLGQINQQHASMVPAEAPPLAAQVPPFMAADGNGQRQQRRSHDGPLPPSDASRLPASFIYEPGVNSNWCDAAPLDAELLPVGLSGGAAGDMSGGPAAETLKKMAALHRRLEEENTSPGNGSTTNPQQLLQPTSADYDGHAYNVGRHRHALSYQFPVSSYCSATNGRCTMAYGGGASKPLSHYPAPSTAGNSCRPTLPAVAFPHCGHHAPEPNAVAGGATGSSSFYMTQSQCVDFRLSGPRVEARATMSQSAGVRSSSPYWVQTPSSAAGSGWTRVRAGTTYPYPRVYPYPQSRGGYSASADERRGSWMSSSPYTRTATSHSPSGAQISYGSETQRRRTFQHQTYHRDSHVLSDDARPTEPPPPPDYSYFVRQKQQRVQSDHNRKWNHPPSGNEAHRWTRRRTPWNHQHHHGVQDFTRTAALPPPPATSHVTTAHHVTSGPDLDYATASIGHETCLGQELFFDVCSSGGNLLIDDHTDFTSFIDDILNAP